VGVSNGARTYLLKAKEDVKEKYDLLLSRICFSACTGCTGDCEPEYCGRLSEWIGTLMVEEAENSGEAEENMDIEAEDEEFKEDI
jgi:hypothetical protein